MIVLLTGGSACGKSSFGEALAQSLPGPHYYLATMQPFSQHDQERIQRHLALREGKDFITLERYRDLKHLELPENKGTVLLECLCNLCSNEMFDQGTWEQVDPEPIVKAGLLSLASRCENLIIVSNDVGSDIQADYSQQTEDYIQVLGKLNCFAAAEADLVVEFVAGVPQVLKGQLPEALTSQPFEGTSRWDD